RNKDNCEACKMTVADKRFATQLVTKKGRQYIFDDLSCMVTYSKGDVDIAAQYVPDYNTEALLKADDAIYVYGEDVGSPMGGNVAAFSSQEAATRYAESVKGTVLTFADAMKKFD
ncbi:MAG: nitrous oxide reductase accessory protein NosL, partial [Candidatus Kapabacteria bacterium]|nr:nitrous oxide reductase accessory protein NosL [Candidatus Kapabacteria bacterium]